MARSCVDLIFGWIEARIASAHSLTSEAIGFVHDQSLGLDVDRRHVALCHLAAGSAYLRMLLLSLHPEVNESNEGAMWVAMAELGARHRPRGVSRTTDRHAYLNSLLVQARREVGRTRKLITRLGRRTGRRIVESLDEAAGHLEEAMCLLSADGSTSGREPGEPGVSARA